MVTAICVNIGSCNGLLPGGTKPLLEPVLSYQHLGPVYSSEGNFTRDTPANNNWDQLENYISKISFQSPRGQWVKRDENSHVIMTVYPIRYAYGFAVFCFVVTVPGIMNAYFVCCLSNHILQCCFIYDRPPPPGEITLKDMGKVNQYQTKIWHVWMDNSGNICAIFICATNTERWLLKSRHKFYFLETIWHQHIWLWSPDALLTKKYI